MPDLISLETSDFEMTIWCKNIVNSQYQLSRTMGSRGRKALSSALIFSPPVLLSGTSATQKSVEFDSPVFFENKSYELEFVFNPLLHAQFYKAEPRVIHRLQSIEDSFRYNPKTGSLRATLNTANDIGWFNIELEYLFDSVIKRQIVAFEVVPVKMDMQADLQLINKDIDAQYPLWRFSLAEKTVQNLQTKRKPHPQFLLLWLAQFENLWADLEKGLKHIVNAPHSRLLGFSSSVRLDRLKGRLSPRLEHKVKEALATGGADKRFIINKKKLSVDTPENRFIKFVINSSLDKLQKIRKLAKGSDDDQASQRLSKSFFIQIKSWQSSLSSYKNHRLFNEVGRFNGLARESLVLQQQSGYAKVYKAWQQLKWYLDFLGDDSSLSVRNVAELYEVWCFLQVRNVLVGLGFEEIAHNKTVLVNKGLDVSMKDGLAGSFKFQRDDGVKIRLSHEPIFREGTKPIRTWMTTQKPDIVLTASFPQGEEFYWLFDAKYRIDNKDELQDLVPEDAINQMHRYRDSLIHQHDFGSHLPEKSRPVFGAYVLYPGFYDQSKTINPYGQAIEEIGIGAFSLLPSADGSGSHWLSLFLEEKLGVTNGCKNDVRVESYFIEEPARISYKGTAVSHYDDLAIVFSGQVKGRSSAYLQRQQQGKLNWYHTKLIATDRQNIERHIIKEVRYLSIAVDDVSGTGGQIVEMVYPVINVKFVKRSELTEQQTGVSTFSNPEDNYWLFELGSAIRIPTPKTKSYPQHFEVLLTSFDALNKSYLWSDLPERYTVLTR